MKAYSDATAWHQYVPTIATIITISIAGLVLVGWFFDLPMLQSIRPDWPKMTANTAVTFMLAGLSLWLYRAVTASADSPAWQRPLGQLLAIFVSLIALTTLSEYLFGWNLGLDQLLIEDTASAAETNIPGRLSPHTAITFIFVGLSLNILYGKSEYRHWLAQYLTLTAVFIALLALVGYAFSISFFFRISAYTGMALHTAVNFIILSVGLIFVHPNRGFMNLMTANNVGGLMARRLLIAAVVVPLGIGWLSIFGQRIGLYGSQFEPVLLAVLSAYGYSAIIWWYAHSLNRMDTERKQAEVALQINEEETRLIIESALDAVVTINTDSKITRWNPQAQAIFGWDDQEALNQSLDIILPPQYRQALHQGMQHFLATGQGPILNERFEISALHRDGSEFPVELTITPIKTGEDFFFSAFIRDITLRKRAEEQFRLVVEASPNVIILVDTAGKISLVNKRAEVLFGYKRKEMLDQPIEMLVPAQFRTQHVNFRDTFFAAPTARPMGAGRDLFGLHKDGSQIPVEIGLNPITTVEGNFVLASIIDITERKQSEAQVAEALRREQTARIEAETAQQRLAFLVEASNTLASSLDYHKTLAAVAQLAVPRIADWCAVDVVEPSGQLRRVAAVHSDPTKVDLIYDLQRRYPPEPNTEVGIYQALHKSQTEFYPDLTESFLQRANLNQEQLAILRELGLKSAVTVPMLANGQAFGTITFVAGESSPPYNKDDVTLAEELAGRAALAVENARLYHKAKHLNEELEQRVIKRTAQLEAANKELESFSYSVSHDLRAPLRSIDGFSQALLEDYADNLDEQAQHYLQRVRAGSQRMAQLIDDLLMLSRLTRSEMHFEPVDLSALAQKVAAELQRTDPEREVQFIIAPHMTAQADKRLIQVMLENLFSNAWKFSSKRPIARIEFGLQPESDKQPVYFVRDNGAGFDMAYADKLFGAFQRLHTLAEFAGTGIGLATVQRIIHRHGGDVWAEGSVEQGATFYFTLGSAEEPEQLANGE